MLMRGGTSKGAYFLAEDLPTDTAARDRLLLALLGSPDPRQIDGHRRRASADQQGRHRLARRGRRPHDIDFLFCQVGVDKPVVDTTPNCGNILAGVAPFAIERGLIAAGDPDDARAGAHGQHRHDRRADCARRRAAG